MLADSVSFDSVNMDPYFQKYWTQMQPYNAYMQQYNAYMQQNSNNLNDSIFNVANQATPTLPSTQDSSSVAFKQNGITQQAKEKHPGRTALLTTLSLAVGAGICIYSKGKAGTKFFGKERWTSGWNNIKKDWFKIGAKDKKYSKLLKSDKVQEYTIAHKGNAYRIKNGKVIEITTSNKKEIVEQAEIEKWLKDNSITDKLKIDNNKLPKGVSLSYRKTVGDHIFEVENGQVVKIFKKDANGNVSDEVSKKVFKNIMEQNKNDVEQALTLTKNGKLKVQLKDENGKWTSQDRDVELNVIRELDNNGNLKNRLIGAKIDNEPLSAKELKEFQAHNKQLIADFDKCQDINGIDDVQYVYRQKGGSKVYYTFNADGNPTVNKIVENKASALTSNDDIEKYLKDNSDVNTAINQISSSGKLQNNYRLGSIVAKTKEGNTCTIEKGKITEITLGKDCTIDGTPYSSGAVIDGDTLKKWLSKAENKNEVNAILELI